MPGRRQISTRFMFSLMAATACSLAQAHAALKGIGDFYAGALHPITSPEHVLPMLALGLLAGQNGHLRMSFTLGLLPLCIGLGAVLSLLSVVVGGSFLASISLAVAMGVLLAAALKLPQAVVAALAIACGLVIGYANGSAIALDMNPAVFIAGLMVVSVIVQAYAMALVSALQRLQIGWVSIAVRVAGSWSAAIGLLVLSLSHRALLLS